MDRRNTYGTICCLITFQPDLNIIVEAKNIIAFSLSTLQRLIKVSNSYECGSPNKVTISDLGCMLFS